MRDSEQHSAYRTVVLFGIVSLLADLTYESARSVIGQYMALLGAGAAAISIAAGSGELVGYSMRVVSGWIADRTQRYWLLVWVGYTMNLLAVPMLAMVGRWELVALLVIVERLGKAIRTPARDAVLASATVHMGHGKGFGLHEALDQIGAIVGPLLIAVALRSGVGYRLSLGMLLIPASIALSVLALLQRRVPDTVPSAASLAPSSEMPPAYRRFLVASCLAAAGFADFPLLAYHLHIHGVGEAFIPSLYAGAMAVDAAAALVLGRLFDRWGMPVLAASGAIGASAALAVVGVGSAGFAVGIVMWGIGMGAHESILRASVAALVPPSQRGRAFGIFSACYGISWFAGTALLGVLYRLDPIAMGAASALLQAIGAVVWLSVGRMSAG
ncbi:MAG: MFS transporter [Chlorobi bacterium]|nr:MFS transporter [Chlorobiota bacterium]